MKLENGKWVNEYLTCEVCNKGEVMYPFPVNIKGKPTWACPECYHKEHPGCMPVFYVKAVGKDARLELQGVTKAESVEELTALARSSHD